MAGIWKSTIGERLAQLRNLEELGWGVYPHTAEGSAILRRAAWGTEMLIQRGPFLTYAARTLGGRSIHMTWECAADGLSLLVESRTNGNFSFLYDTNCVPTRVAFDRDQEGVRWAFPYTMTQEELEHNLLAETPLFGWTVGED